MMKTTTLNRALQAVAACALLGLGSASWAATTTWNLNSGCATINGTTGPSCTSPGGVTVAASGYSTAGRTTLAAATVYNWANDGLGVQNRSDGDHSTDNSAGTDLIALNFGSNVNLSAVTMGWWSGDADITVLAYTGAGAPTLANKALNTFTSASGWTSVKNYSTTPSGNPDAVNLVIPTTTDSTTYSSWWLISAYNSSYGAGLGDSIADYFKLLSVAGTIQSKPDTGNKIPEPGSLALIGLGLLGMVETSRRRKAAQASKSFDLAA